MKKRFKQRTTSTEISKPPYHQNTPRELRLARETSLLERAKPVLKPPCPGAAAPSREAAQPVRPGPRSPVGSGQSQRCGPGAAEGSRAPAAPPRPPLLHPGPLALFTSLWHAGMGEIPHKEVKNKIKKTPKFGPWGCPELPHRPPCAERLPTAAAAAASGAGQRGKGGRRLLRRGGCGQPPRPGPHSLCKWSPSACSPPRGPGTWCRRGGGRGEELRPPQSSSAPARPRRSSLSCSLRR